MLSLLLALQMHFEIGCHSHICFIRGATSSSKYTNYRFITDVAEILLAPSCIVRNVKLQETWDAIFG